VTLVPFYAGQMGRINGELVEWDGTNEADICDWLNDRAVFGTPSTPPWSITSVTGSVVVFTNADDARVVTMPIGFWLNAAGGYATVNDPAGRWKTSDPYGRPEDLNDMLA
jgi:hypothetical protein